MIFQELSVARNCLRPDTALLIILAIKRGLLQKLLRVAQFMRQSITISNSSNLSLQSLLKNMSKIPILDLKKKVIFFKFCFMFKMPPFCFNHF